MKWRVTILGPKDTPHTYDVDTGWPEATTVGGQIKERQEAVKRARQLHRAATGKPGIYSDMEKLDD